MRLSNVVLFALSVRGTHPTPNSISRCQGLGPDGKPYPECVGVYSGSQEGISPQKVEVYEGKTYDDVDIKCRSDFILMNTQIYELKKRYYLMLLDEHNLYSKYKNIKGPYGSWKGHIFQYKKQQSKLQETILRMRLSYMCRKYITPEAEFWNIQPPPSRPNKTEANLFNTQHKIR